MAVRTPEDERGGFQHNQGVEARCVLTLDGAANSGLLFHHSTFVFGVGVER
jgi:hypothetical protein